MFHVKPERVRQSPQRRAAAQRGTALDVPQQCDQRGRRHAGDARGGAEGCRPAGGELAADLGRQAADLGIVKIGRQQQCLVAAEGGDVALLPVEIARIARVDFELLGDLRQ